MNVSARPAREAGGRVSAVGGTGVQVCMFMH